MAATGLTTSKLLIPEIRFLWELPLLCVDRAPSYAPLVEHLHCRRRKVGRCECSCRNRDHTGTHLHVVKNGRAAGWAEMIDVGSAGICRTGKAMSFSRRCHRLSGKARVPCKGAARPTLAVRAVANGDAIGLAGTGRTRLAAIAFCLPFHCSLLLHAVYRSRVGGSTAIPISRSLVRRLLAGKTLSSALRTPPHTVLVYITGSSPRHAQAHQYLIHIRTVG